jgi:alkylhydroperoxidase/carboxymuconolactone decarboxylase family protein YurZ
VWSIRSALLPVKPAAAIAALVSQDKECQLRGHLGGALNQGITPEELTEAVVQA